MKKRNALITGSIVVVITCLLLSISSALIVYDHKNLKIRQVTEKGDNFNPEWSPDGSKIVYASTEKDPDSCIWIVDQDGNNRIRISQPKSDYEYYEPTWSPDGSKIAFVSHATSDSSYYNNYHICVMDADGSNVTEITPRIRDQKFSNPKWSPDGSKIMYDSRSRPTHQSGIWVMDSNGNNKTQLTFVAATYNSTWSPDGTKIAYEKALATKKEIWVMEPDGSNKTRLMPQKGSAFEESFTYFHPSWNPAGTKIAFVTDRFSEDDEHYSIAVLDLEDNSVTALTKTRPLFYIGTNSVKMKGLRGDEFCPEWSPEGSKILFITGDEGSGFLGGEGGIWVMNPDGKDKTQLTFNEYPAEGVYNPKWSPDGSKILFERKYYGSRDIFVMTLKEIVTSATTPSPEATIDSSVTPTPTQLTQIPATTSPTLTPLSTPATTPGLTPEQTVTPTEVPIPEGKGEPGFEAIPAIAGLLAVAYLLKRRRTP